MKMNDTVARIVEIKFQDVEMNEETSAIRDEVMNNCQERYNDLVASGMAEDDAIAAVIESLNGMEEVLAPYKKKVQHVDEMDDDADEMDGEVHACFAAYLVKRIDVALVNEDVTIEASDDDSYHVTWDTNESPLVQACVVDDVLRIDRKPGEEPKVRKQYVEMPNENIGDFIKTEEGKIEINMDSIGQAMKSLGDKLKIMFSDGIKINVGRTGGGVTIQVPEGALPKVKVLTTSGDVDVQDVALGELTITSTSGDMNIALNEDQHLPQMEMRTTSGDIEVSAFAQCMLVSSTSGDVDVEGRIDQLSVSTISGDIDVRADVRNVNFKAISGDVDLAFDSDEIREVNGSTISGDIDIDLPEGIGAMGIHTQTRSGDVTTRCQTNGVGPTVMGSVTTMSGDITIR